MCRWALAKWTMSFCGWRRPAQVTGTTKAVDNPSVQNMLGPMDSFPFDMHSSRSLTEGNAFTIGDATPRRYRVDVYGAPDGYCLRSVRVSGQDATNSGMMITDPWRVLN